MSRQNIYGQKTKKLEKNVIQSVYQMTQEAVFALSTSVLKSALSTWRALIKKCINKVFIVMNVGHCCQWFGAPLYESV